MTFKEFGKKTLPCGTISYSYVLCIGGYMIRILNLDTLEERYTAGVSVNSDYISVIMTNLIENNVTVDNMHEFILNEMSKYLELHPPKTKRNHSKYLYL